MRNRKKGILLILSLILCWSFSAFSASTHITSLRVKEHASNWRLVFDAKGPLKFRQFTLKNPNRLVIDIQHARLWRSLNQSALKHSPVKRIRHAEKSNGELRLVFDLCAATQVHSFALSGSRYKLHRLVVDLIPPHPSPLPRGERGQSDINSRAQGEREQRHINSRAQGERGQHHINSRAQGERGHSRTTSQATHPRSKAILSVFKKPEKPPRNVIIVIDPGHGGKDPGASGPRGTHEKNIVLAISKQLQRIINQQPGFKAVLTRKSDYYISLRRRLRIARQYHADMFIAIHADAYRNREAHGASVYALSRRGATGEAARWLARRENQSELMGGVELSNKDNLLKSVLINLSQTATIHASLLIGEDLIKSLDQIASLHHRRVEQAAFVVLKSPDIPSLLVETGFLSNPYEERRLRSSAYRQRLALAIMQGIRRYFKRQPPRGTWLAYWRDHPRIVASGA